MGGASKGLTKNSQNLILQAVPLKNKIKDIGMVESLFMLPLSSLLLRLFLCVLSWWLVFLFRYRRYLNRSCCDSCLSNPIAHCLHTCVCMSLQKVGSSALQNIELLSFRKHRASNSCMVLPSRCISVQCIPPVSFLHLILREEEGW